MVVFLSEPAHPYPTDVFNGALRQLHGSDPRGRLSRELLLFFSHLI